MIRDPVGARSRRWSRVPSEKRKVSAARAGRCSPPAREMRSSFPPRYSKRYVEFVRARRETDLIAADLVVRGNLKPAYSRKRPTRYADRNRESRAARVKLGLYPKVLVEDSLRFRRVDYATH